MAPNRPPEEIDNDNEQNSPGDLSRRTFLRWGALAGAGASLAGIGTAAAATDWNPADAAAIAPSELEEATIAELQAAMASGDLSSAELVQFYLSRIQRLDQSGPNVNSVIEVNPQALGIARALDRERASDGPRGPLHGIPVLLKDNIDTRGRMMTTAGSLALVGAAAPRDATVTRKLREAGAVILGKANLSEWANFRGFQSSSGWSGRGGQTRNPYVLDRNPCGSSSGSAAAVAANFTSVALGTETDGSIVCPATTNGVVGIKPTVGLTSRAGVIPISHSQDTVGPHTRTVADAAAVLGALTGVDPRDPATQGSAGHFHTDYTQFLDPDGLNGARIGVARNDFFFGYSAETDAIIEEAIQVMRDAGAVIVDPAEIPSINALATDIAELVVLVYEFKRDLNAYLATRTGVPVHTMADVIAFNLAHAQEELLYFGQEWFELSQEEIFSEQEYIEALARSHSLSREQGLDAALQANNLDALVAPTGSPAWPTDLVNGDHFLGASSFPSAMAGYPIINVPAGHSFGLPVGISFMGTAYSEPTLIKLAYSYEQASHARRKPRFLPTLPLPTGNNPFNDHASSRAASSLQVLKNRIIANPRITQSRIFGL